MSDLNSFIENLEEELKETPAEEVVDETTADGSLSNDSASRTLPEGKAEATENASQESESDKEPEVTDEEEGLPSEPESKEKESKQVPLEALKEERQKRQELERQLQEARRPVVEEKPKDFFEDPEQYLGEFQNALTQQAITQRIEMSEFMVKREYEDYDDKLERFMKEAQVAPSVLDQLQVHPHPAMYVYETAEKLMKMDEYESLDSYKESLSAKLRKEIEEEVKAKYDGRKKKAAEIPKSISDVGSTATEEKEVVVDVDAFLKNEGWKRK